jgi:hypothetical protein
MIRVKLKLLNIKKTAQLLCDIRAVLQKLETSSLTGAIATVECF